MTFELNGAFKDPEVAAKEKEMKDRAAAAAPRPSAEALKARRERSRPWPTTRSPSSPSAASSASRVVLGALICGGFYFFWLSDAWKEEATKKAKREALQKEIRALEVTANKLQEFQREVQLLEASSRP